MGAALISQEQEIHNDNGFFQQEIRIDTWLLD